MKHHPDASDDGNEPAPTPLETFDSHLHIIDPRFPLTPNQGWLPDAFTVDDYLATTSRLPFNVTGGAVVSGSFQGFDQTYLLDALERLGPTFVGVTQVPASVTDEELHRLDSAGVRAVRFNLRRGGSERVEHLAELSSRVHHLAGWHTELYVEASDMLELEPLIAGLPSASIDHLGLVENADGPEFHALLRLVERGVKVKATGFGRVAGDVATALRAIADTDPTALMFGTDLPSTRAPRPFASADVTLVTRTLGTELAGPVLHTNANAYYLRRGPPDSGEAQIHGW